MNMKKTIAAIAAGAVAVSAMATTVSALEAKTLTYNLVKSVKTDSVSGTVVATFTNVPLEAGGSVIIEALGIGWAGDATVTINGSFWDDTAGANKTFDTVVATVRDWDTGYSIEGSKLWQDGKVVVPIVANASGVGTNVALRSSSNAVIRVSVKYHNLPSDKNSVGGINGLIKEGKRGIKLASIAAGVNAGADSSVKFTSGTTGGTTIMFVTPDIQATVNNAAGKDGIKAEYDGAKWVVAGVAPTITVSGLKAANEDLKASDVKGAPAKPAAYANEDCNQGFVLTYDGTDFVDQYGNKWTVNGAKIVDPAGATVAWSTGDELTIAGKDGVNKGTAAIAGAATIATALKITPTNGDKIEVGGYAGGAAGTAIWTSDLSGAATEAADGDIDKYPYHSTLKNNIYNTATVGGSLVYYDVTDTTSGSGDIISWIGYANSDSSLNKYNTNSIQIADAARSVINDAIQNWDDVTFTFNTATSKVKDGKYAPDWDNDAVDYRSFGRHFWDRDTGYDANTIYITNDWLGNNLFEGALIINNNLTLSLGATDKFDWTATSLSFSWDAIQDAALTQNQYANYIQNMVLRTSTDWYWDNMTVVLGETEVEEVETTSPVSADDQDLDEDLVEDLDEDEDFGGDEDEDEEEDNYVDVDTDTEPDAAPVEVASNPGTGNAPVALAVIPVALAAAAVVAKKRG